MIIVYEEVVRLYLFTIIEDIYFPNILVGLPLLAESQFGKNLFSYL